MTSTDQTELQERYHKLAAEFSKLRSNVTVLKKAVIDEQGKREDLTEQLKIKDLSVRKLEQEVDSLMFRNQQLMSRVEFLQDELDSMQKSTKKNKKSSTITVGDNIDTSVLSEELKSKIQENMQLHVKIGEQELQYERQIIELNKHLREIQNAHSNCHQLLEETEGHSKSSIEKVNEKRMALEVALHKKETEVKEQAQRILELEEQLAGIEGKLGVELETTKKFLAERVPFIDTANTNVIGLNLPIPDQCRDLWIRSTLSQLQPLVTDLVQGYVDLISYWEQRVGAFPVDVPSESETCAKCRQKLHNNTANIRPIEHTFKSFAISVNRAHILTLETVEGFPPLSAAWTQFSTYLSDILPLQIKCIDEECQMSMCPENLQSKNMLVAEAQKQVYQRVSDLARCIAQLADRSSSHTRSSQQHNIYQLCATLQGLAADTHAFSQQYHMKVSLEHSLATTSKKLRSTNECILNSLMSVLNTTNKIAHLFVSGEDQLLHCLEGAPPVPLHPATLMFLERSRQYLQSLRQLPRVESVPYNAALEAYKTLHSSVQSRDGLLNQVQSLQHQVTILEQKSEKWKLECRLLEAKIGAENLKEKKHEDHQYDRVNSTVEQDEQEEFGDVTTDNTVKLSDREEVIKIHYSQRLVELTDQLQLADSKAVAFYAECKALHHQLLECQKDKREVQQRLELTSEAVNSLKDELHTTSTGYSEQLSTLSEHLAAMNDKLAQQHNEIVDLRSQLQTVSGKAQKKGFLGK